MDFDDNEPIRLEDNIGCLLIVIVFIILTIIVKCS
jgi:hypothetical protein